jgi:hypothetical protein
MKTLLTILLVIHSFSRLLSQEPLTPFEKDKLTTTTYPECIRFYEELAEKYDIVKVIEYGETDFGKPLHLIIISKDKVFDPEEIRRSGRIALMINNGIHAGEPDGIDASMMLFHDLASGKVENPIIGLSYTNLLDHVVIINIAVYNVGGFNNRNSTTRVNQVGPKEYGFRGNAQNRDLNRDFIKCDAKNAMTFAKIYHEWKPELFVDTHTTDGADYPYKMTYIAPAFNKPEPIALYMKNQLLPYLEGDMKKKNFPICPYVTMLKSTPDSGIVDFPETPRYSTGYISLFNTIGFVSESHMLKTHQERVEATYEFLITLLNAANSDYEKIKNLKLQADENAKTKTTFVLKWQLDSASFERYLFSGYEAKYKKSNATGFDRLYYDRNSSYTKEINFYNKYWPEETVTKPIAYIIPQGWWQVIERLKINGVEMKRMSKDQPLEVESYYIESYDTKSTPYEGHYLHSNTKIRKVNQTRKFFEGDYVIYTNQASNNFIMHVLEPESPDSYFNWNFFDAVLQQKEYYDEYLFEDIADSLLKANVALRKMFEGRKTVDEQFRNDPKVQLDFIYENSVYHEAEHMQYPVARMEKEQKIELK